MKFVCQISPYQIDPNRGRSPYISKSKRSARLAIDQLTNQITFTSGIYRLHALSNPRYPWCCVCFIRISFHGECKLDAAAYGLLPSRNPNGRKKNIMSRLSTQRHSLFSTTLTTTTNGTILPSSKLVGECLRYMI
jgi:hypothetical protein